MPSRAKSNEEPSITDVNEKVQQLQAEQLRIVIVLMATGKNFAEAYEVALTFKVPITE